MNAAEVERILSDLVAFDSVSARSNLPMIGYVERHLRAHGIASRRVPSPDGTKASLLATIGNASLPGVVLSAHTDVVPVDGQAWTVPPFRTTTHGDRVHGRGTTDMKGFLAVVLAHIPGFAAARGTTPIHLAFSYDEEVGCRGAPDLVAEVAALPAPPALVIVGEPTRMRVARTHKGKFARRLTITGRTGHSAMPHRAANAVAAAAAIAVALDEIAEEEAFDVREHLFDPPFTTVHVGSIHGGGAVNLVPDRAVLEYEVRYMPGRDHSALMARIDGLVDDQRRRLRVSAPEADIVSEELSAYPALDTPAEDRATRLVALLAGDTCPPVAVSYGTEAGIYAAAGLPTLVCGPGDMAQGHKPDEWIERSELLAASAMMERLARAIQQPFATWEPR